MAQSRCVLVTTDPDAAYEAYLPFPDVPAAVEVGRTERVQVWVDAALGPRGRRVGEGVLAGVEEDIDAFTEHFGGVALPDLPISVVIAQLGGVDRAYHYGPAAPELYCDARTVPQVEPRYTRFLVAALLVDLFAASRGRGWDPGTSAGEALSRVLAASRYPRQIIGFETAAVWLDSDRDDYVSIESDTDRDPRATGCAVLFLHWLHDQLGHSWADIIAAAGPTLVETAHRLHGGASDPFAAFAAELAGLYPPGRPSNLETDNPFPRAPRGAQAPEVVEPEVVEELAVVVEPSLEGVEATVAEFEETFVFAEGDDEQWSGDEWLRPATTELDVLEEFDVLEEAPTSRAPRRERSPRKAEKSRGPREKKSTARSAEKSARKTATTSARKRAISESTLRRLLTGVKFPASRSAIVAAARTAGGSDRVLATLGKLPTGRYRDRAAVVKATRALR